MSGYYPGATLNRRLLVGTIAALILFVVQSCTQEENPGKEAVSTTAKRSVLELERISGIVEQHNRAL